MIGEKENTHAKAKRLGREEDWMSLGSKRNQVQEEIKFAKKHHTEELSKKIPRNKLQR